MTDSRTDNMDEAIIEQAAEWVSRLQGGEVSRDDNTALQRWLDQSPEHEQVFARMSRVMDRTAVLRQGDAARHSSAKLYDLRPRLSRRILTAGALAAALAMVAVTFVLSLPDVRIETAIGERRSVQLEDGSMLHLNALSAVDVTYERNARRVTLQRGEALFDVVRDPARPFVVESGALSIEVLGTTFSVTAYENDQNVAVVDGRVAVNHGSTTLQLSRGQQVRFRQAQLGNTETVDIEQVAAWRDGWLYHERQPLQALVDRLNRQYHGHIDIADDTLAHGNVNVVLRLEDREQTLQRLQQLLPIVIDEAPGERATIRARD